MITQIKDTMTCSECSIYPDFKKDSFSFTQIYMTHTKNKALASVQFDLEPCCLLICQLNPVHYLLDSFAHEQTVQMQCVLVTNIRFCLTSQVKM